jgi:hypothetical protein
MAASIDDAVRLLTDPANLAGMGRQYEGAYAVVSGPPVLRALQGLGLDVVAARVLVGEALHELGGIDRSHDIEVGGLRPGRVVSDSTRVDVCWVPRPAMREPAS